MDAIKYHSYYVNMSCSWMGGMLGKISICELMWVEGDL